MIEEIVPRVGSFFGGGEVGGGGVKGRWYFTLNEQVLLGPASALLRSNVIFFHILTFRNIVHDVKVVDRCLATTLLVSWQQVDKVWLVSLSTY